MQFREAARRGSHRGGRDCCTSCGGALAVCGCVCLCVCVFVQVCGCARACSYGGGQSRSHDPYKGLVGEARELPCRAGMWQILPCDRYCRHVTDIAMQSGALAFVRCEASGNRVCVLVYFCKYSGLTKPYICTVYMHRIWDMTVHLIIFLPQIPDTHRIYMVLANPTKNLVHVIAHFLLLAGTWWPRSPV